MANLHFEAVSDSLAELPPEDRAMAEDLYVQQTGVLPTPVKKALLGGLLSSDPAAQVAAAQRLAKLEEADPAVSEGIPEALRARGRAIAGFALPGVTPERVVELAEKRVQQSGAEQTGLGGKAPAPEVVDETRQKAAEELGAELEVLEGSEAEPPGQGGAGEDQTVFVIRDPQSGETKNVTLDQLAALESLADDDAATPEDAPDELVNQIGELVLSVLPVTGEAISARDAYLSFRAAQEALEDKDLAGALLKGGETALNALGAIPVIGGAVRAPKAVAKAVPALLKLFGRLRRRPGIGRSRKLTIGDLEGMIAPKRDFPRKTDRKIKEDLGKRDEFRRQRLDPSKGPKEQTQLLKKQKGVEVRVAKISGEAYHVQIEKFLTSLGFRILARKIRKKTPKGITEIDLKVADPAGSKADLEIKLKHSREKKLQAKKQEFAAEAAGIARAVIREGTPIKFTHPLRPGRGSSTKGRSTPGRNRRRPK